MNLYEGSVKRPITILMVVLVIMILGIVSLGKLNIDLYPSLEMPIVATITEYDGVGPEEIEQLVTKPIEGSVSTLSGIKEVRSNSNQNVSMVISEFEWGTDMDYAEIKVREKVDFIKTFLPEDVSNPMIFRFDVNMFPVMIMGVTGDRESYEIKEIVEDKIVPYLERIDGVASVEVTGGDTREIQVVVDAHKLESYNLSVSDLRNVISMENSNSSGGLIDQGKKNYLVRVKGEYESLEDLGNILVPLKNESSIELKYISDIEDTFAERKMYSYLNGQNSIGINIYKQSDANTVEVSEKVNEGLKSILENIPKGVEIKSAFDSAEFINKSIDRVKSNGLIGALLAIFILYLFLRNIRSTLIVGTAIPISIIATFILLFAFGQTLNIVSLGGLALGIGMMIDSAIVVLENIYRFRTEEGYQRERAAISGTKEVASAVVASTITTICVFLPMVFVEGLSAQLFRPMALTVSFSLFASLMVALTFIPMLASKILSVDCYGMKSANDCNSGQKLGLIQKVIVKWQNLLEKVADRYEKIIVKALNNRKKVIFSTIAMIVISGVLFSFVGKEFIPQSDSGYFTIDIELPKSTDLEETKIATERVEQVLSETPEVDLVFISVGSGGGALTGNFGSSSNISNLTVRLKPLKDRKKDVTQVMDDIRTKVADIAGADISIQAEGGGFGGSASPISIELKGNDLDKLRELSDQIAEKVKLVPNTREVKTSFSEGVPELDIRIDRDKANLYDISSSTVSRLIRETISGAQATKYRENGNEYDVKIMLLEEQRSDLDAIKRIMISSSNGVKLPLEELAEISYVEGPSTISRKDQSRIATITGDISGRDLGSITKDIQESIKDISIPAGYTLEMGESNKDMAESFTSLALALLLAVVLVYMVLAAQFEALLYPFIIMFSIPPTFIGITLGLLLTGRTFGVTAFIGVIMLAGIVVNNAIVLVDYTNTLRKRGMDKTEALVLAGKTRLRPILMTTATTVLALIPQAIGIGEGAEMMAPMATVVVFGLTFSTLITLVLIPVIYYVVDAFADKYKHKLSKIITGGQK